MKQNFNVKLEFKRNETEKLGKNFGWIISAIRLSNLVLLSVSEKANGVYHFCVFFFGTNVWLLLYAPLIIHITQLDCGVCVCVCCSCLLCLHLMYNIPNSLQSEFTFDIISFDIPSKVLYSPSIYLYLYFHSVRQPGYVQNNTRSIPCTKLDTHFHPHFVVFVREWEKEISITKQQKYIFNFRSRDVIFLSFGFFVPFRFVSFCMFFFFATAIAFLVRFFFSSCLLSSLSVALLAIWLATFTFLVFLRQFLSHIHRYHPLSCPSFPCVERVCVSAYNLMDDIVPMQTLWDFFDILSSLLASVVFWSHHLQQQQQSFRFHSAFLFLTLFCFGICN